MSHRPTALITGGAGLIGSHIVDQALARGWLTAGELRRAADGRNGRVMRLVEAALAEAGMAGVGA